MNDRLFYIIQTLQKINATCSPLEGSKNPSSDCCQKTAIPMPLEAVLANVFVSKSKMHAGTNMTAAYQCSQSLIERQRKIIKESSLSATTANMVRLKNELIVVG